MRIAVVGLGFMGSTHLQALRKVPEAKLAAVVSDDPRKLEGDLSGISGNLNRASDDKLDFSTIRKYRRVEDALADPEIDAVDLCLPTHLHAPIAAQSLQAGKHVLVEKPMALSGAECDELIRVSEASGKMLMVAHVLRFWDAYQPLIDVKQTGRLGEARSLVFRRRCAAPQWGKWLQDPAKGGGGVFDLLIHDVDMCVHLFGLPESVSATGYEDLASGIDLITAQLHYAGIGSVIVSGGWHHPTSYPFSMEYTASFQGGTIEFSTAGRPATLYSASGNAEELKLPDQDGFVAELAYFTSCAKSGKQPERCHPRESAQATKLTLLLNEARNRNGEKVPCLI
jgi:predicted dehydrogenase